MAENIPDEWLPIPIDSAERGTYIELIETNNALEGKTMKLIEVKKGEAEIKRGQVMMAVEGEEGLVMGMVGALKEAGHEFSDCVDESEDGEGIAAYFMIDRRDIKEFKAAYKAAK